MVSANPAPTDQARLDQFNKLEIEALWNAPELLKVTFGWYCGLSDADARLLWYDGE